MVLATLCYIEDTINEKTLMLHRTKKENDVHEGKWNGLGGKFEKGESCEDCVIREIKEESGLEIKNPKLKGIVTFPSFLSEKDWHVYVFTCNEFSGELIDSPEGDLEWIDSSKLLDLNIWDGDEIFIPWLKNDKFFSAKFIYENGKLKSHEVNFY